MIPPWSDLIKNALAEDIGRGDLTTNALVDAGLRAHAILVAKEELVVCGLPVVAEVFRQVDSRIRIMPVLQEGSGAQPGNTICNIEGPARGILTGERVALNFFQNLSGVATTSRRFVELLEGTNARIVDTRKTTPGMRLLQKYAVRVGGAYNHRMGLDDGVLIKDNHIALAGGVTEAIRRMRDAVSHLHRIEVECSTLDEVQDALDAGADVILLDNMNVETLRTAVGLAGNRVLLEASGNMTMETVRQVAETGVHMISVGFLTHSAGSRDVSLRISFEK
ncbi:MAG: carboxylating nicotinate-nucleotide diphosphorylase [Magnetococcales bacterium]|nr:carboxylating nicotinate-nucleotide diphosphorylase [Magnetococcales bacterium]NGZ27165.1 carboxylating nicotinate-nucleotide diphosphorylase [Magnetococcales bacterium]